jgi:ADP-ribose pyrophosphatase YjhB (NUDIX family)
MTTLVRDTFCSYCGEAFESTEGYPRACPSCKTEVWANPIPVSVVLLPVVCDGREGLLVVRRGIEPGIGQLALVGGFLEEHETCAEGGVRELREETGVVIDAATLTPFWFTSTAPRPNRVLLFSTASAVAVESLAPFTPNAETQERGLVFGPRGLDEVFAFPLHAEAARLYFAALHNDGDHAFRVV